MLDSFQSNFCSVFLFSAWIHDMSHDSRTLTKTLCASTKTTVFELVPCLSWDCICYFNVFSRIHEVIVGSISIPKLWVPMCRKNKFAYKPVFQLLKQNYLHLLFSFWDCGALCLHWTLCSDLQFSSYVDIFFNYAAPKIDIKPDLHHV